MGWFKKKIKKIRFKTDVQKNPEVGYDSKIKEINNLLEKNENKVMKSESNLYVEERKPLNPHKPKYSSRYTDDL